MGYSSIQEYWHLTEHVSCGYLYYVLGLKSRPGVTIPRGEFYTFPQYLKASWDNIFNCKTKVSFCIFPMRYSLIIPPFDVTYSHRIDTVVKQTRTKHNKCITEGRIINTCSFDLSQHRNRGGHKVAQ